jgi:hypothetical protein
VILVGCSNEWNLSPAKEGSSKKKQRLKSKRCETSDEEAPYFKEKRG